MRPWSSKKMEREDFAQLIAFLAAVPLFQKQLPRAELPKVAQAMQRQIWKPGEKVVIEGEEGKAFFVIQAGEATVYATDPWGEDVERATLYHADYFGGHTLTEKRPNVATIMAKGPQPLETLSITKEEFERLGLHRKLKFLARPAIYEGRQIVDGERMNGASGGGSSRAADPATSSSPALAPDDISFILKAVQENSNIRARGGFTADDVRKMASTAQQLRVNAGTELLKGGELGHDFFVVAEGAFELIPATGGSGHRSVEARLATSNIHDRLARKQQFLMGVLRKDCSLGRNKSSQLRPGASTTELVEAKKSAAKRKPRPAKSMVVNRPTSPVEEDVTKRTVMKRRNSSKSGGEVRNWLRSTSEGYHNVDIDSPFLVGEKVARVFAGERLMKEVGKVLEIVVGGPEGEVLVEFPGKLGAVRANVQTLRPVEEKESIAMLRSGECIGELALLYNTRQMAMHRAARDSMVYVIEHRAFKECFSRESAQLRESIRLLDEVHMLTPLLRAERAELARNSTGVLHFKPEEVVLRMGDAPDDQLWYVVEKGSGSLEEAEGHTTQLHRGSHFGEREIVSRATVSSISVKAGPNGMTCLVFEGEIIRNLRSLDLDAQGNVLDYSPAKGRIWRSLSMVELDSLSVIAILGEGGFGSVYLARHGEQEYALKRMSKGYIREQNMKEQICAERDILSLIDSPFIIRFYRSYKDAQYLYMLIEYATGGHLYSVLTDRPHILEKDEPRGSAAMFYIACVAYALEHMHERRIVYRDLKPENILLDGNGFAKICDLGFARFVLGKTNTMVGTPEYMAPEMIDSPHAHDFMVDWWALGVLAFELLTLQVPWNAPDSDDVMLQLLSIRKGQDSGVQDRLLPAGLLLAKDFIRSLLTVNEEKRLGAQGDGAEVRKHPWFTYSGFDFAALYEQRCPTPYSSPKKVVERVLPTLGLVSNLSTEECGSTLFVEHEDDGTNWDEAF